MRQKGEEKQDPLDQRSRGLNVEHPEGQANIQNQEAQEAAAPPPPATKKQGT